MLKINISLLNLEADIKSKNPIEKSKYFNGISQIYTRKISKLKKFTFNK